MNPKGLLVRKVFLPVRWISCLLHDSLDQRHSILEKKWSGSDLQLFQWEYWKLSEIRKRIGNVLAHRRTFSVEGFISPMRNPERMSLIIQPFPKGACPCWSSAEWAHWWRCIGESHDLGVSLGGCGLALWQVDSHLELRIFLSEFSLSVYHRDARKWCTTPLDVVSTMQRWQLLPWQQQGSLCRRSPRETTHYL